MKSHAGCLSQAKYESVQLLMQMRFDVGPSWSPSMSKTQGPTRRECRDHSFSSDFIVTPQAAVVIVWRLDVTRLLAMSAGTF